MFIAGEYSFNGGKEAIESRFSAELQEVREVVAAIKGWEHGTKTYRPDVLNSAFGREFQARGWHAYRVRCDYPTEYYVSGYSFKSATTAVFREMDFVKNRVGVDIQFAEYGSVIYDLSAKMTIFHKLDVIDVGVEIVPLKDFANRISAGVSYFEQFVWDLEQRGISDIDIPVLILGVTA